MKINRRVSIKYMAAGYLGCWSDRPTYGATGTGAPIDHPQGFEAEFPSMGSKINLRWYTNDAEQDRVVDAATNLAERWENVLSDYAPSSQTSLACAEMDTGHWVALSNELWSVVWMCDQWHRWSNGAFDAALGAITRLRRQRKLASQGQWEEARSKSGWKLLELDGANQSIRSVTPGVRLDFGAIGKGVVVDKIAEKLAELEIDQYVVNASGNMRIGRSPPDTEGWPIAIDFPAAGIRQQASELLRTRLSQCGIATSGDRWQRFPDASGAAKDEYSSHIINPQTNVGVAGHQSVTIIAENATDADAAATATCVRTQSDLAGWLKTLAEKKPTLQAILLLSGESNESVRMISTANEL